MITMADSCNGAHGAGPVMLLKSFKNGENDRCMVIDRADDRLILFPVGAMRDLIFMRTD